MLEGVKISESKAQKDELILEGTDVQNVSQSGAQLSQFKISFFFSLRTSLLSFFLQPPLSKVFAESETRISESSWTVSTYQSGARLSRSREEALGVCFYFTVFCTHASHMQYEPRFLSGYLDPFCLIQIACGESLQKAKERKEYEFRPSFCIVHILFQRN